MLCALSDRDGSAVDWWFIYKLPKGVGRGTATAGNAYLYYDPTRGRPLELAPATLGSGPYGAWFHTLHQIFGDVGSAPSASRGWICYNDEYPADLRPGDATSPGDWPPRVKPEIHGEASRAKDRGKPVDHPHNGHCKGILALDLADDSAIWISHSTPKLPDLNATGDRNFFFPAEEYPYGQTFLCITLDGVRAADAIAAVLVSQHEPQVFSSRLPAGVGESGDYANLWRLAQGIVPPDYGPHYEPPGGERPPADLSFSSRAGKAFRLLAKSGAWRHDLWLDWLEPQLGADLRVETWRRLTATATLPVDNVDGGPTAEFGHGDFVTEHNGVDYHHEFLDVGEQQAVDEVTTIDLGLLNDADGKPLQGLAWSYTRDHAKWAVSEPVAERGDHRTEDDPNAAADWICIADMNRMTSQEIRGGGAICFHEPLLWRSLNDIERIDGAIT